MQFFIEHFIDFIIVGVLGAILIYSLNRGFRGLLWDIFQISLFATRLIFSFIGIFKWFKARIHYSIAKRIILRGNIGSLQDQVMHLLKEGFQAPSMLRQNSKENLRKNIGLAYIILLLKKIVYIILENIGRKRRFFNIMTGSILNYSNKLVCAEDAASIDVRYEPVDCRSVLPPNTIHKWTKDTETQDNLGLPGIRVASELLTDRLIGGKKQLQNFNLNSKSMFYELAIINSMIASLYYDNGSSLFGVDDIIDWPGFLSKLSSEGKASQPSPGKRIWELLPLDIQVVVENSAASTNLEEKQRPNIIKALNESILSNRDFYQKEHFSDITIPEEAQKLLPDRKDLSARNIKRLNRLLMKSAYSHEIADDGATKKMSFVRNSFCADNEQAVRFLDHFRPPEGTEKAECNQMAIDDIPTFEVFFRGAVESFPRSVWGCELSEIPHRNIEFDIHIHFVFFFFRNLSKVMKMGPPHSSRAEALNSDQLLWDSYEETYGSLQYFFAQKPDNTNQVDDNRITTLINQLDRFAKRVFIECGRHECLGLLTKLERQFKPAASGYSSNYCDFWSWRELREIINRKAALGSPEKKNYLGEKILKDEELFTSDPWKEPIWDVGRIFAKDSSIDDIAILALTILTCVNMDKYDRIIGIGGGGLKVASLISLLCGKAMTLVESTPSIDIRPKPSKFERILVVDDIIQSKFTIYNIYDRLKTEGYNISESDIFTISHCVGGFGIQLPPALKKPFGKLSDKLSCIIEYEMPAGKPSITLDQTDSIIREDKIISRCVDLIGKQISKVKNGTDEQLFEEIMDCARSEDFYKPERLYKKPDLIFRTAKHIYEKYIEGKNIDGIIVLSNIAIPFAIAICLLDRFTRPELSSDEKWLELCFINTNRYIISDPHLEKHWENALVIDSVLKTGETYKMIRESILPAVHFDRVVTLFSMECFKEMYEKNLQGVHHESLISIP